MSTLVAATSTAPTTGPKVAQGGAKIVFQAYGSTTSGTGAASIQIHVSVDGDNWIVLGTITLTLGVTITSDGFSSNAPWPYVRGYVASLSGTGATVTTLFGV